MTEIEQLVQTLARLPGLGPRSARRAALYMLERRDTVMEPLARALSAAATRIRSCSICRNLDTLDPCAICTDPARDGGVLCVVETVADLWALERSGAFRGRYHVLGGTLSALAGVGPEDLGIPALLDRITSDRISEVILATNATVEGQTTAHYIAERLAGIGTGTGSGTEVVVSGLALGVPVGGELDYLDDGTLDAALNARRRLD